MNSGKSIVSHVLRAIGLDEKYVKGTIRISFGKDNTKLTALRRNGIITTDSENKRIANWILADNGEND